MNAGRFHTTVRIGDHTLDFQRRIPDPFVRVNVKVSLWTALGNLLRHGCIRVTVLVGGDPEAVDPIIAAELARG